MRIGHGYDIHRLVPGRKLILGGIEIPHSRGLDGHSDADALTHALCDALLGALALPDIGHLFPNTDPQWKGADSQRLLAEVVARVHAAGWRIGNVDASLIAEEPKIAPHLPAMRARLSATLHIPQDCIGLKATTNEKIGDLGRCAGIAAHAVCLLVKKP